MRKKERREMSENKEIKSYLVRVTRTDVIHTIMNGTSEYEVKSRLNDLIQSNALVIKNQTPSIIGEVIGLANDIDKSIYTEVK